MVTPSWGTIWPLASTAAPRLGLSCVGLRRLKQKISFFVFSSSTVVKNWSDENKQRGKMGSSPEGEVTVLAEETVAGGDGSNSTKSKTGASVLLKRDVKTEDKNSLFEKKL